MFGNLFDGPHLLIVLAIVVLLFGATRLPALARALGQSRNRLQVRGSTRASAEPGLSRLPTQSRDEATNRNSGSPRVSWPLRVQNGSLDQRGADDARRASRRTS